MMGDPPSSTDRRLLGYVVLPTELCAAVALLTLHCDLKWWSTTLQFGGALIASGGLGWSYLRVTRFWERKWPGIRAWLWRIFLHDSGPVVVGAMGATLVLVGFQASGKVTSNLDRSLTLEEQIAQLEGFINRVIDQEITPINNEIVKLKDAVKEARSLAETKADEALSRARAEIARLAWQLDQTQTIDIRWAIGGLFISAIGVFFQYWT
jgi:uncharacterized protein YdcH (DUF465 family)